MQSIYVRKVICAIVMMLFVSGNEMVSCPLDFSGCAARSGVVSGEKRADLDKPTLCTTCLQRSATRSRPVEDSVEEHEDDNASLLPIIE